MSKSKFGYGNRTGVVTTSCHHTGLYILLKQKSKIINVEIDESSKPKTAKISSAKIH